MQIQDEQTIGQTRSYPGADNQSPTGNTSSQPGPSQRLRLKILAWRNLSAIESFPYARNPSTMKTIRACMLHITMMKSQTSRSCAMRGCCPDGRNPRQPLQIHTAQNYVMTMSFPGEGNQSLTQNIMIPYAQARARRAKIPILRMIAWTSNFQGAGNPRSRCPAQIFQIQLRTLTQPTRTSQSCAAKASFRPSRNREQTTQIPIVQNFAMIASCQDAGNP